MSYAHAHKCKMIRRFKRTFGKKWYPEYASYVSGIQKERQGIPVGTLEEIVNAVREVRREPI